MAKDKKSKSSSVAALRGMTAEDLNKELLDLRTAQCKQRMQFAVGEVTQTHLLGESRKQIARIKTVLNEKSREAAAS